MSEASKRADTLRHKQRLTIDEAAYLVQDWTCGYYDDALSVLIEAASNGSLPVEAQVEKDAWSGTVISAIDPATSTVATVDIKSWLATLGSKVEMPVTSSKLMRAAVAASASPSKQGEERPSELGEGEYSKDEWVPEARRVASALHRRDTEGGAHDSTTNIADRVAKEFRRRGIDGPRGPLSGQTILREALQGGRWKRTC
jgi:hypothetical protein